MGLMRNFFIYFLFKFVFSDILTPYLHPDAKLTGLEIAAKYGYNSEEHFVITEDGYILSVFRIRHKTMFDSSLTPIVLLHGMTGSADVDDFLCHREKSSTFSFADQGYDLWLPNNRGTRYSQKHQKLDPSITEFWNFTFEEMGVLDCPAVVEYIVGITKFQKVTFLGFCEGNTQLFIGFALKPAYFQKRTQSVIAWAPVTNAKHLRAPGLRVLSMYHILEIFEYLGFSQFFPYFGNFNLFASAFCYFIPASCYMGYRLLADIRPDLYDTTSSRIYMGHFPAGTSLILLFNTFVFVYVFSLIRI